MKIALTLFLLIMIVPLSACAQQASVQPTSLPAVKTALPLESKVTKTAASLPPTVSINPTPVSTSGNQSTAWKQYANSTFGLSFHYPAGWFGPDVYAVEQTLRLAIGSDVVYPYGTDAASQI